VANQAKRQGVGAVTGVAWFAIMELLFGLLNRTAGRSADVPEAFRAIL